MALTARVIRTEAHCQVPLRGAVAPGLIAELKPVLYIYDTRTIIISNKDPSRRDRVNPGLPDPFSVRTVCRCRRSVWHLLLLS